MLVDLPEELLLTILGHLDEQAVVRLASTCHALLTIARSDEAWRDRVEHLVNVHARTALARSQSISDEDADQCLRWKTDDGVYERYVQGNLGITARYCGWWASTQAYRGRLLRVSLHVHDDGTVSTVGEEVSVANAFAASQSTGHRATRWKPRSAIWSGRGLSYRIPQNHASPDAGYSVDILDPILQYTPLFRFTQSTGFALFSSVTGVLASSIPIDLNLRTHFRRKLRDTSGSSGMYGDLSSYSQMVPPAFPSRDAVRAGLIRDIGVWQSRCADAVSSVHLQGDHLTASTFILQPRRMDRSNGQKSRNDVSQTTAGRSSLSPAMSANGVAYITQPTTDAAAHTEPALLNGPNGGSQLLRIIMQGIGTILPAAFQETLLGEEGVPEDEDQEIFYPVQGPLRDKVSPGTPLTDKCTADSLRGLWVGTYSTHGYELGIISIRYIWTKIHLADEIELEQIYDDPASADDAENAMPMFSREPLQVNLEGSIRRRRAIVEFVKLTGDANVPAGQVSWVAILPTPLIDAATVDAHADDVESLWNAQLRETAPLADIELPTVLRSDWEAWSDSTENGVALTNVAPCWDEGTLKAAGRIAMAGFMDTRFIGAEATFVREASGQVDEIRVKWHEMVEHSGDRSPDELTTLTGQGLLLQTVLSGLTAPQLASLDTATDECSAKPVHQHQFMRMRFLVRMAWAACSAALFTTRLNACSASDAHPAIVGTAIPGDRGMPLSIAKHPIFRKPEAQQQIPLHGNCSLSVDDETTVHLFLRRAQHMPEHGLARRSLASTVTNSYQQTQARLLTATGVCTQQRSTITRTRTKTVTHHSTVRTTRTVTRTVHRKTQTKHKSKFTRTTKSKPKTSRPSTSRSSHRTNSQPTQTHNFSETSRASSQKSTSRTAAVSTQKAVGSSAANGMLSGFPLQAVSAHNWWRKVYHVGGLRWNATLAAHALEWGKQCRWEHDPRLQGWMEGQNMATEGSSDGSAVITGDSMVSSWVKGDPDRGLYERTAYDPDNPQASHFTQVVWASATQIGCALINCPASFAAIYSPSWPAAKLAVCNYNTGNIVGQFGNNVPAKKGGQPR